MIGSGARPGAERFVMMRWIWWAVFLAALAPAVRLVLWPVLDLAGANPIEFVTRSSGTWALVMLCMTLAMSPLRRLTGWPHWLRLRRMLGLVAFLYATLHMITWLWLDQWFDPMSMLRDIVDRPFIAAGVAAFVLMIPLARDRHPSGGGRRSAWRFARDRCRDQRIGPDRPSTRRSLRAPG
jgi:sulfoxide reductase heme-binding subunit YedZ